MQPYSQETLGSFLVRWAWARGEQPAVLSHRLGLGYFVWTRDLDRSLSEEMLQAIAAASGCRLEQVRCMTYCSQLAAAAVPDRYVTCAPTERATDANTSAETPGR